MALVLNMWVTVFRTLNRSISRLPGKATVRRQRADTKSKTSSLSIFIHENTTAAVRIGRQVKAQFDLLLVLDQIAVTICVTEWVLSRLILPREKQ